MKRSIGIAVLLLVPLAVWADTNAPGGTLHVPAFDIPVPANVTAWVAEHGFLIFIAIRGLIKWLTVYEGKSKLVDSALTVLEHSTLQKDVTPVAERPAFAEKKAEAKAELQAPTDNGLPRT